MLCISAADRTLLEQIGCGLLSVFTKVIVNAYKMSKHRHPASAGFHHQAGFEEIEHTADRALRIYGSNLAELLLNAARGLNSLMVTKHIPCSEQQEKIRGNRGVDSESLLVDWLSELAYWAEIEMLVFHEFKIESRVADPSQSNNIRHPGNTTGKAHQGSHLSQSGYYSDRKRIDRNGGF